MRHSYCKCAGLNACCGYAPYTVLLDPTSTRRTPPKLRHLRIQVYQDYAILSCTRTLVTLGVMSYSQKKETTQPKLLHSHVQHLCFIRLQTSTHMRCTQRVQWSQTNVECLAMNNCVLVSKVGARRARNRSCGIAIVHVSIATKAAVLLHTQFCSIITQTKTHMRSRSATTYNKH